MFLSRLPKNSLQRELDDFSREVLGGDFSIREVTKGAFSQARAKLKYEAFIELNENVNKTFYEEAPYLTWHGMRLLAIDGTTLNLPHHPSIREEFPEHGFGPKADNMKSLARASCLFDCLNLLTVDAVLAPYNQGERELLYHHVRKLQPSDLLVLDRGYASLGLFFTLKAQGTEFCMRMSEWWLEVRDFKRSDEKERTVYFSLPEKEAEMLKEYPNLSKEKIACRLVKVELENGECQVLCTSLLDAEMYTIADLSELYHHRWKEEEAYKLFKARADIENFSGKTALAVKQDFYAGIYCMSLCAVLAFPIEAKVREESKSNGNKHQSQINRTSALSMIRKIIPSMFFRSARSALEAFENLVSKTKEIVRPGRHVKRKKGKRRSYHMNYKPL